jgi:hypothetical protein
VLTHARKLLRVGLWLSVIVWGFGLVARADTPDGRDCSTATTIDLGKKVRGAFIDTNDRAVYRFVFEQRGLLDVWVAPGSLIFGMWNCWIPLVTGFKA